MSIVDVDAEEGKANFVEIFTEPLKIPQPRNVKKFSLNIQGTIDNNSYNNNSNNNNNFYCKTPTNISTSTTTSSSFHSLSKLKILNCDSPQIFSIESRAESRGLNNLLGKFGSFSAGAGVVTVSSIVAGAGTSACVDGSEAKDSNSNRNDNNNDTNMNKKDASEFGGYREVGTSSGFNSDFDSESPFYSSDIDSDTSAEPSILWNFSDYFSSLPGNDWCVRIPQCFIDDEFNLFELPDVFSCPLTLTDEADGVEKEKFTEYCFDDLIDFITIEDLTEDPIPKISQEMLNDSILLYKLIHQRFIMTKAGLQAVWEKFENQTFGTCPRFHCHDQPLLPIGLSALPNKESVRVYCLNCQDLYSPSTLKHSKMDGVPFGPSFAHFFVRTCLYANDVKALENRRGPHDWQVYIPKIYGFKISKDREDGDEPGIRSKRPKDFK